MASDEPSAVVVKEFAASSLGLTSDEAAVRRAVSPDRVRARASRTYRDIVWSNTFTVFNVILGSMLGVILVLGSWRDGLFGGVIIANMAIGIVQEIRAKRTLDRLALRIAPTAQVWRDGALKRLPPDDLVVDDVIHITPGDQAVADGYLLESRAIGLDESVLTGESETVNKAVGEEIQSGSYCVAGSGDYVITAAGPMSFAERLAAEAQGTRSQLSPLQLDVNRILTLTVTWMIPLAVLLIVARALHDESLFDGARTVVAALVPLIPEGLVLLVSLTFAVAALRLSRLGVLAQRLNAIESLASVDVVCIDKTGTLTDNRLRVSRFAPAAGHDEDELRRALAILVGSAGERNATLQAIGEAVTPVARVVQAEIPFTSAQKWSGLTTADEGSIVLGAPDVLERAGVELDAELGALIDAATADRHRVVLLAQGPDALVPHAPLPPLTATGAAILNDGIRSDAIDTVRFLTRQGTAIKVISGDNAQTVQAVASQCGIPLTGHPVDGSDLPSDDGELEEVAERTTIFGRVTPHQKQELVRALTRRGHYVAMIGDGVNDVLALKEARLAIAMGSGSQMAKGVSDVVLLESDFGAVPRAIDEGRRILRNTHRVAKLFVSKTVYAAALLVTLGLMPIAFPFLPRHLSVTSSLTIGIPAFFLALAPSSGPVHSDRFLQRLAAFTVPIGVIIAGAITTGYLTVRWAYDGSIMAGRTASVIIATALGLGVVVILERETGGGRVRWWVWAMVAGFAGLMTIGLRNGSVRAFFEATTPNAQEWAAISGVIAVALVAMAGVRHIPALRRFRDADNTLTEEPT